jgi:hypothetical protein
MAIVHSNAFTGANGTLLTAGGAWAYVQTSAGTLDTAANIQSNQLAVNGVGKTGSGVYRLLTNDAAHYIKAAFQTYPSGQKTIGVRVTDIDNGIFLDVRSSNVFLYKRVAGVQTTLGSAVNTNAAGAVYEVNVTAGGTPTVTVKKDGAAAIITSTNIADVPASQYVGIQPTAAATYTIDDVEVGNSLPGDSLTMTSLNKVYQRQGVGNTRAVPISGTYGGGVTGVEYRIESGGVPLSGFDWQAPSGLTFGAGVFSFNTAAVPQGGMYTLRLRAVGVTLEATSQTFAVGVLVGCYGQSNAVQFFETTGAAATMPATCWLLRGGVWVQTATYGASHFVATLQSLLGAGVPIGAIQGGTGGQSSTALTPDSGSPAAYNNATAYTAQQKVSYNGRYYQAIGSTTGNLPTNPTYWNDVSFYLDFAAILASAASDVEVMYWNQGEAGINNSAIYKSDLAEIRAAILTLCGRTASTQRWLVAGLGRYNGTADATTETTYSVVRQAQREFCSENTGALLALTEFDIPQSDIFHFTGAGQATIGQRLAYSLANAMGVAVSPGYGPAMNRATVSGSTVTVNIALNGATSLTKASGGAATGWQVSNDDWATTLTISDVQISGSNVVITMAAPPGPDVRVRHLWAAEAPITNLIKGTGYAIADIGLQGGELVASPPSASFALRGNLTSRVAIDLGAVGIDASGRILALL